MHRQTNFAKHEDASCWMRPQRVPIPFFSWSWRFNNATNTTKKSSFKSKKSPFIIKAEKIYNVDKIVVNNTLAKATGCSKSALSKIINKGEGAYFSSGSRPNQTAQSWGIARLASAITSGKAAAVDYTILENGCKKNSKALTLAKKAKKKYGYGTRKVPKVTIKNK